MKQKDARSFHQRDLINELKNLLEEVENLISCDSFVLMPIQTAEGRVWLELLNLAKDLPLSLYLELSLCYRPQEVPQAILCVKT